MQAELALANDSVWLWVRDGRVFRKALNKYHDVIVQELDVMPVAVTSSPGDQNRWAIYDRRTQTVQTWMADDTFHLRKIAQSDSLSADKLPKFILWLDEQTIVLADAISSIWIYTSISNEGVVTLSLTERLPTRGTFALQGDARRPGVFWIGNKDGCASYRVRQSDDQISLEPFELQCLQQGVVRQVSLNFSVLFLNQANVSFVGVLSFRLREHSLSRLRQSFRKSG